jgi:hypothetical protein
VQVLRGGHQDPFRPGSLGPLTDVEFYEIDLKTFADLSYKFMCGIPFHGSAGFSMMGPEELKKQRWTFVKHWAKELNEHVDIAVRSMTKR